HFKHAIQSIAELQMKIKSITKDDVPSEEELECLRDQIKDIHKLIAKINDKPVESIFSASEHRLKTQISEIKKELKFANEQVALLDEKHREVSKKLFQCEDERLKLQNIISELKTEIQQSNIEK